MSGWNDYQEAKVKAILADLHWLIAHESLERYVSERPYEQPTRAQVRDGHKFDGDCSGTIKLIVCKWHGIPVFDGLPNGYGDTASFFRGPKVYHVGGGPAQWQPLDLLLYKSHAGPFRAGPGEHVTILLERPATPSRWRCFSMGSTPGPHDRAWNYRDDLAAVVRFPIPLK